MRTLSTMDNTTKAAKSACFFVPIAPIKIKAIIAA